MPPGVRAANFTVSLFLWTVTNRFMSLSAFCAEADTTSSEPATTGPSPLAVPKAFSVKESRVQPATRNKQADAAPTPNHRVMGHPRSLGPTETGGR